LLAACSQEVDTTDTREPIAVQYVSGPEMPVHREPNDRSPVITRFQHGESVPVLTKKGDWVEVRTALGSGWGHQSDLVSAEKAETQQGTSAPSFRHAPSPVTAPGARGSIYILANVNTDGDVTSTKILENSTGSDALAAQNAAALERAKFYPIVQHGTRKPFEYYYRVDY
jgi:TonB family protein